MRRLQGIVAAERRGDGSRLNIRCATGERFDMDLSAAATAELVAALQPEPASDPEPADAAPAAPAKTASRAKSRTSKASA